MNQPCQSLSRLVSAAPERARALPDDLAAHATQCMACKAEVEASRRLTAMLAEAGDQYTEARGPTTTAATAALVRRVLVEADARHRRPAAVRIWAPIVSAAILVGCIAATVWFADRLNPNGDNVFVITIPSPAEIVAAEDLGSSAPSAPPFDAASAPVEPAPHALTVEGSEVHGLEIETGRGERKTLELSDGTTLQLNHGSKVLFPSDQPRTMVLERGEAILDVVRQAPLPPLLVELPTGTVRVVGTRLLVSAQPDRSVVDVLRGKVVAMTGQGSVDVTAGREAVMRAGHAPTLAAANGLADATRWAEVEAVEAEGTMGIGTLTARRPGAKKDTDQALRLTDHRVSVTIQGQIAKTEIEEAFHNDTKHTLEGVYSFPLPAGAKIAGLELLVEDTWMEGAIVAKDRGEKIWAGVIRNATPKRQRKEHIEYVWVPGPWRDPAILTWKEGSRFELRIFPIPAHAERRVRIAYTETLQKVPAGRRYVYPLAEGASHAVAERFRVDATIGGVTDEAPLRVSPYDLTERFDAQGAKLSADLPQFVPKGDLVIDVPDSRGDEPLRAWAWERDGDGYALLALAPELPLADDDLDAVLFVVDRSYSTQAARLERAARVVRRIVGGLDRDVQVGALACATQCESLSDFRPASSLLAADLRGRIERLASLGATRIGHAMTKASAALRRAGIRRSAARVVYLGDGVPSMGELDPERLGRAAGEALGSARLVTVSLGGEVDDLVLRTMAAATGGARVSHAAGDTVRATAFEVLARLRATPLRDVELALPDGLREVAPAVIGDLWPGEERLVAARLGGPVEGRVVLKGTLGGEPFEQAWEVALKPTSAASNAFLPRVWAERRIDDLQASGADPETIVALSTKHHVLSRHTSLLVLESEAMHEAFDVPHTRPDVEWNGAEADEADASAVADGNGRVQGLGKTSKLARSLGHDATGLSGKLVARGRALSKEFDGAGMGGLGMKGYGTGGGAGMASNDNRVGSIAKAQPKRETRVRVRPGTGKVSGFSDRNVINRVVRRHMRQIRHAYERALKSEPNLSGKVAVKFTIGPNGAVTAATATGSAPARLRNDIARIVRRWRFPASGNSVTVTYPFVFSSTGGGTSQPNASPAPRPQPMGVIGRLSPRRRRGGRYVPMKKVWYREARVRGHRGVLSRDERELQRREARLDDNRDSRDRTRDLVRWYVRTGDLDSAQRLAAQWLERDRLDAGALVSLSDVAALRGEVERSRELLASAVDADPGNPAAHERMITLYDASGAAALSCEHTLTKALKRPGDWKAQVAAVRCGHAEDRHFATLKSRDRRRAQKALKKRPKRKRARDKLTITAEWDGDEALDVVVVTPKGRRVSFQGGAKRTKSADAEATGRETLALSTGEVGRYQVFVVHRGAGSPTRGKLRIRAHGSTKTLKFRTDGRQAAVGDVTVERKWRHERVR